MAFVLTLIMFVYAGCPEASKLSPKERDTLERTAGELDWVGAPDAGKALEKALPRAKKRLDLRANPLGRGDV